jgi:hypothetical protein
MRSLHSYPGTHGVHQWVRCFESFARWAASLTFVPWPTQAATAISCNKLHQSYTYKQPLPVDGIDVRGLMEKLASQACNSLHVARLPHMLFFPVVQVLQAGRR